MLFNQQVYDKKKGKNKLWYEKRYHVEMTLGRRTELLMTRYKMTDQWSSWWGENTLSLEKKKETETLGCRNLNISNNLRDILVCKRQTHIYIYIATKKANWRKRKLYIYNRTVLYKSFVCWFWYNRVQVSRLFLSSKPCLSTYLSKTQFCRATPTEFQIQIWVREWLYALIIIGI